MPFLVNIPGSLGGENTPDTIGRGLAEHFDTLGVMAIVSGFLRPKPGVGAPADTAHTKFALSAS